MRFCSHSFPNVIFNKVCPQKGEIIYLPDRVFVALTLMIQTMSRSSRSTIHHLQNQYWLNPPRPAGVIWMITGSELQQIQGVDTGTVVCLPKVRIIVACEGAHNTKYPKPLMAGKWAGMASKLNLPSMWQAAAFAACVSSSATGVLASHTKR